MRENSGSIKKNDKKTQPNHSDIVGSGNKTCPHCNMPSEFWINGWNREGEGGSKFYGLNFKDKEPRAGTTADRVQTPKPTQKHNENDLDDDIPF